MVCSLKSWVLRNNACRAVFTLPEYLKYAVFGLGLDSRFAQDPLLGEYVNEKVFGEFVKEKFHVESQDSEPAELTDNDLNALQYAAGYVPRKLRQKYKKTTCKHPNRKAFLVCLDKWVRWSFTSPILTKPKSEAECLLYTKSSLTLISSKTRQT